jgi:hypothetical protein
MAVRGEDEYKKIFSRPKMDLPEVALISHGSAEIWGGLGMDSNLVLEL